VIVGPSGAGKSTLARALARRLDIPHLELDSPVPPGGWTTLPTPQFRAMVGEVASEDAWVIDGNYNSRLDHPVFARADRHRALTPNAAQCCHAPGPAANCGTGATAAGALERQPRIGAATCGPSTPNAQSSRGQPCTGSTTPPTRESSLGRSPASVGSCCAPAETFKTSSLAALDHKKRSPAGSAGCCSRNGTYRSP